MSKNDEKRKAVMKTEGEGASFPAESGAKLPVAAINYEEDAVGSFDGITNDDRAIPFLKLLQTNSPECDDSAPEYIPEAKAGLFINSVTKELLGNSVTVIPCAYKRIYNKWGDRDSGGGFKGALDVASTEVKEAKTDERGRLVLGNGDYLADTRNYFILVLAKDQTVPMLLALTSTQIKKAKNWMAQIQMLKMENNKGQLFTPPMFSHFYVLTSVTEKNDKGSWKGVQIALKKNEAGEKVAVTETRLYSLAREFAQQVQENKVTTHEPVTEEY